MLSTLLERLKSRLGRGSDRPDPEPGGGEEGGSDTEPVASGLYRCPGCGEVYLNDAPHSCSSCDRLTVPADEARSRERDRARAEREREERAAEAREEGVREEAEHGQATAGNPRQEASQGRNRAGSWSRPSEGPGGNRRD